MPVTVPCPRCRLPVSIDPGQRPDTFPFCCSRCRTADLAAWAEDRYVIAGRTGAPARDQDGVDLP